MITGRDLVEKLYSNSEENYSELDYLLERAFSEGYEYAQREFAEEDNKKNKKKKHLIRLEDIKSHRGLGRSIILGGGISGAIGGYVSKSVANDADKKGLSDEEIKKRAERYGAGIGAATGAGLGALLGKKVKSTLISSGLGALGGYAGANKNIRTRLKKRKEMEDKIMDDED